jgi:predicted nucleotidyltransferase component of viral defense system
MSIINEMIKGKLENYDTSLKENELKAVQEVTQELVLYSLSGTDFFEQAVFHGGTALRILFGINRFSEDLDFCLIRSDDKFQWNPYLGKIQENMSQYGCRLEIQDRSRADTAVKKAFIKDNSIGQMLNFSWATRSGTPEKIRVKLEIDTNPPLGGREVIKTLDHPFSHRIKTHDLPSLFAGKCHALLTREYIKGRDWFDFLWYCRKGIEPNYRYLSNAMNQMGPFQNKGIKANWKWLEDELKTKIAGLDVDAVKTDVVKFINEKTRNEVNRWNRETFLSALTGLQNTISRKKENSPDIGHER